MRRAGARLRRLAVPAASTAAMLAILCGLGVWQVHRLAWKTDLLARIDAAERGSGIPLPPSAAPFQPAAFQKVDAVGTLRPETGRYGVDVRDTASGPKLGSEVVAVLQRAAGKPVVTLLGWLPDDAAYTPPSGRTAVAGYVRAPVRPGWFTPPDEIAKRRFFTLDPAVIGAALGVPDVAPFTLVRLQPAGAPAASAASAAPAASAAAAANAPVADTAMPRPPNDHLQYAITWFGLAAVLLVIFAAYARKVMRS